MKINWKYVRWTINAAILGDIIYVLVWGGGYTKGELLTAALLGLSIILGYRWGHRAGRKAKATVDAAFAKRLEHVLNGGEDTGEDDIKIKLVDPVGFAHEPPLNCCKGGVPYESAPIPLRKNLGE